LLAAVAVAAHDPTLRGGIRDSPMTRSNHTVFVSSTYHDLVDHRRAVWEVLERFEVSVRGMEQFGARTEAPLQTCLAEVEQSDVYVGIIGFKLGSVDQQSGKSFTQLEYERAVELKKEVLIYVADEQDSRVRVSDIDVEEQTREKLRAFKRTLRDRHTVDTFVGPKDLAEKLGRDFRRHFVERDHKKPAPADTEFQEAKKVLDRFFLLPNSESGTEIRLRVELSGEPFPAARAVCTPFVLTYGSSIGIDVTVIEPAKSKAQKFRYLFATDDRADRLVALSSKKGPMDLYAVLKFTDQDVARTRAEIIGYSYYAMDDWDDGQQYVSPEGYAILLFSKLADA